MLVDKMQRQQAETSATSKKSGRAVLRRPHARFVHPMGRWEPEKKVRGPRKPRQPTQVLSNPPTQIHILYIIHFDNLQYTRKPRR